MNGLLVVLLGAWGALVPFVGPYFGYAYTPDAAWAYTAGRLVLSILPGAAAVVGGLLAAASASGPTPGAGPVLAALGGAWFVVGVPIMTMAVRASALTPGTPVAARDAGLSPAVMRMLESLGFFSGLGVVLVFLAALALGRSAARFAAGHPAGPAGMPEAVPKWRRHAAWPGAGGRPRPQLPARDAPSGRDREQIQPGGEDANVVCDERKLPGCRPGRGLLALAGPAAAAAAA